MRYRNRKILPPYMMINNKPSGLICHDKCVPLKNPDHLYRSERENKGSWVLDFSDMSHDLGNKSKMIYHPWFETKSLEEITPTENL